MITEDYISFKTAKLLKEKGFDETCRAFWKKWNGEINLCDCNSSHTFEYCHNTMLEKYNDYEELNIAAPTLQMAMKWLREVYNLVIQIVIVPHTTVTMEQKYYVFVVCKDRRNLVFRSDHPHDRYSTYEEAAEAAIKYCLEKLI